MRRCGGRPENCTGGKTAGSTNATLLGRLDLADRIGWICLLLKATARSCKLNEEVSYGCIGRKARHKIAHLETGNSGPIRDRVAGLIELADQDVLDIMRSRACEQEVLDLLDDPQPGEIAGKSFL